MNATLRALITHIRLLISLRHLGFRLNDHFPRQRIAAKASTILRPVASQGAASSRRQLRRPAGYVIANSSRAWLGSTESAGTPKRKTPHQAGFLSTLQQPPDINRYPGSCAAAPSGSGDAACAGPSLRSGGCARGSRRTACRPLPACGRCSCRCRSACAAPWLPSG